MTIVVHVLNLNLEDVGMVGSHAASVDVVTPKMPETLHNPTPV